MAIQCAGLIRSVQEGEREKLKCTMQINALRKAYEFKEFDWQLPHHFADFSQSVQDSEIKYKQLLSQNTKQLGTVIDQINEALDEIRCIRNEILESGS